jgi:hypothetical protein
LMAKNVFLAQLVFVINRPQLKGLFINLEKVKLFCFLGELCG